MAKYKVEIRREEYFRNTVVVEASDPNEAIKKVAYEWEHNEKLYENTTDILYDVKTKFCKVGKANEEDIKNSFNID